MSLRAAFPLALLAMLTLALPTVSAGALGPAAHAAPRELAEEHQEPTLVCIGAMTEMPPRVRILAECGGARVTIEVTREYIEIVVEHTPECQILGDPCAWKVQRKQIELP